MADATAIKVFISYSRKDREFVARVVDALEATDGIEVFRDTDDILPTEEWQERLEQLIREADTVVFALSPHSAKSQVCAWEVELAESLNKRIAPVVIRDVEGEDIPPALAKLNYIFFTNRREFDRSIGNLVAALNTDIGWIREHTRLAGLARRWDLRERPQINVLRGADLKAAEEWIATQPRNAPAPTELHHAFVQASRHAATRRQRIAVGGSLAAAVFALLLAGYAFVQQRAAESALRTATDSANRMVFQLAEKFEKAPVPGRIIESILDEARGLQDELSANFPGDPQLLRSRAVAVTKLGDVYARLDDLATAKTAYEEGLSIARTLASADTASASRQRDVAVILEKIAEARLWEGDLSGARAAYEEGLEIMRAFAGRDPESKDWQRDTAVMRDKIGDILMHEGKDAEALAMYQESLRTRRELAAHEPDNTEWQRDVSVGLDNIGELRMRKGDFKGAGEVYQESLKIRRALAERDPSNTQLQRDISVSLERIGDVRANEGASELALKAYEESLGIARALIEHDGANTQWQRDITLVLDKIGGFRLQAGNVDGAVKAAEESLGMRRALAERDPANAEWQRDVAISLQKIGDIRTQQGDDEGALEYFQESLRICRELLAREPANVDWQRSVAMNFYRVGDARLKLGQTQAASSAYRASLEMARALVANTPGNARSQIELVISLFRIANIATDTYEKRTALEEALGILVPLETDGALTAQQKDWPDILRKMIAGLPAETAAQ